ncbi:MAG TPA: peptide chain release factor N(5)-glutamine methyltransferase [Firmicutes bacterium]|nr:peptide chain release factor N(5)-glutamine methyltransferase [Bacillota bacterium]
METNETFARALNRAAGILKDSGQAERSAYNEVKSLLSYITGIEYKDISLKFRVILNKKAAARLIKLAQKRAGGYPLQYITGVQDFYGRDFIVKKGVFIPRFDTQALIEELKKCGNKLPAGCVAAECGCGTGIISITLLLETDKIKKMLAYDISKRAAVNTRLNARMYGCGDRLKIYEGDFFKKIREQKEKISIIVSNPPYIDKKDAVNLPKDVLKEPKKALYGSLKGLSYYKRLASLARGILPQNGLLAVEIGDGMESAVAAVCKKQGFEILTKGKDSGGHIRALVFELLQKR